MNILITNSAKSWGGNELWTTTAANALAAMGHKVTIAARTNIFDKKLHQVNLTILHFRNEFDPNSINKLIKLIKTNQIDIIIATKRKEYWMLGHIGKLLRIPVVFRHGIIRHYAAYDIVQRYIFSTLPKAIIVNAQAIKDAMLKSKVAPADKIHVIYNGYAFDTDKHPSLELTNHERFTFGAAGRLTAQKGYDILLEAVNILAQERDDFQVCIAGKGESSRQLDAYIEQYNLQHCVKLLGEIYDGISLFKSCDAVVIPSRAEGVPNTLFEAWSVKKPVIGSKAAGIPEVVSDGVDGLLVDLTPSSLAQAMRCVLDNRTHSADMGINGYNKLHRDFTLAFMTAKLERLLLNVIEANRG